MRILVACEESQRVCLAFRARGHEAFSCDLLPCSGGHPEFHIQADAIDAYESGKWDMVLAFPPCDHLCYAGSKWFHIKRKDGRQAKAVHFFAYWTRIRCPRVMIENPVGVMSRLYRKPDQMIHPWQYGHGEQKRTCLWLRGLPLLRPTNIVEGREQRIWKFPDVKDRNIERSKTYPGIAEAMADQWSGIGIPRQLELFYQTN